MRKEKLESLIDFEEKNRILQQRRFQLFGAEAVLNSNKNPATDETTQALKNTIRTLCEENSEIYGDSEYRTLYFDNIKFNTNPFKFLKNYDSLTEGYVENGDEPSFEAIRLRYNPEIFAGSFSTDLPSRIKINTGFGVMIEGIDGLIDGPGVMLECISTHRATGKLIIERELHEYVHIDESWIEEKAYISAARQLSEEEAQFYLSALIEALTQDSEIRARLEQTET